MTRALGSIDEAPEGGAFGERASAEPDPTLAKGPRDSEPPRSSRREVVHPDGASTDHDHTARSLGAEPPPTPASLPSSGPSLEKYELFEELGHGGMATVYRARDRRLGREVAVKVIHRHLRENAEVAARFLAEARASAKLRHPNIIDVFDVSDEAEGERYLVAELMSGTTLRKVLQEHRELPAEVGASLVLEVCAALEHAHDGGIVHRDVKPENVLVELPKRQASCEGALTQSSPGDADSTRARRARGPDERAESSRSSSGRRTPSSGKAPRLVVKLTDFGIAKILDAAGYTSTGQVLGSPSHMAPEQIEAGEVDSRTDVFALGVMLYECLVGHLPFEGKNPAQVLRRVLDGTYPPPDRERPTVGSRWAAIVAGALARDPAERTPSAAELARQIRQELEGLGVRDPHAEVTAYFSDPQGYVSRSRPLLVERLVARAEARKRAGDSVGAAADYNRALALAPDDLALLRRAASLSSDRSFARLVRRAGLVLGLAAVFGAGAFGVSRWLRSTSAPSRWQVLGGARPEPAPSTESATDEGEPLDDGPLDDPESTAPHPHDAPSVRPRIVRVMSGPPARPPSTLPRKVRFHVRPAGARLLVDGRPVSWLTETPTLSPGPHEVTAEVASKCCRPKTATIVVTSPPVDEPERVQPFSMVLDVLPAQASFSGGPSGAQVVCPSVGLTLTSGASTSVALGGDVKRTVECDFSAPGLDKPRRRAVALKAGESVALAWPE